MDKLMALIRAAATEAAKYQDRFAAADTQAQRIVEIMERFLRIKGRVVYGGAAINAHLSAEQKFYDPSLYLPDYDFMTPDPLQDCADLITAFQEEGFEDVEAKFGIHEGTYKIFVDYRAAADITFMPPIIYERLVRDATDIDGIRYASPDYLRMNMYLELSRPAGMIVRWEKVYQRLLLLNAEYPVKGTGPCPETTDKRGRIDTLHARILAKGIDNGAVFLCDRKSDVLLMIASDYKKLVDVIAQTGGLTKVVYPSLGELLPSRTEFVKGSNNVVVAVVFEPVACHNYTTQKGGFRLGSVDLLIQMYYAFYFADIENYVADNLLCHIKKLVDKEKKTRLKASLKNPLAVFPMTCIGHQPTMPELKKAHRLRVREKREEMTEITKLKLQDSAYFRRSKRSSETQE